MRCSISLANRRQATGPGSCLAAGRKEQHRIATHTPGGRNEHGRGLPYSLRGGIGLRIMALRNHSAPAVERSAPRAAPLLPTPCKLPYVGPLQRQK